MLNVNHWYLPYIEGILQTGDLFTFGIPTGKVGYFVSMQAWCDVAPSGDTDTIFDVEIDGVSIFDPSSTRPKIEPGNLEGIIGNASSGVAGFVGGEKVVVSCAQTSGGAPSNVRLCLLFVETATYNPFCVRYVADQELTAYDAVLLNASGKLAKATNDTVSNAARFIGIVPAGIQDEATGDCIVLGEVTNPGWGWTPGQPVFLGSTAGIPTQTVPTSGISKIIGTAITATMIWIQPQPAIDLG